MTEKFEIEGYRKVPITENDSGVSTMVLIAKRETDSFPSDSLLEEFAQEYQLDRCKVVKVSH